MTDLLQVPKKYSSYLIEFYNTRLNIVRDNKTKLDLEEKELLELIAEAKQKSEIEVNSSIVLLNDKDTINQIGYDVNSSWWEKSKFILKEKGKELSTAEIVHAIIQIEKNIDRKIAISSVSAVLGSKTKINKLERIKREGKDQKFKLRY